MYYFSIFTNKVFYRTVNILQTNIIHKKVRTSKSFINTAIRKFNMPEYVTYSLFAIVTGALAGFAAVVFHESIKLVEDFFFEDFLQSISFLGAISIIIIPAIGMLIQSGMTLKFPKIAKKKGNNGSYKSRCCERWLYTF